MSLLSGLLSKKKKRYGQSYSQQYPSQLWEYGDHIPFQYAQPNSSYQASENQYPPGHYNANTPQLANDSNLYVREYQPYQQPIQAQATPNQSYTRNNPYLPYQMESYSPQIGGNSPYQEPYNPYVQHPYYQGNTPLAMPVSAGYPPPPQQYGYPQQQIGNQAHYQVNPFQNPLYHQDEDFGPVQTQQQAGMYPYPKQNNSQKPSQIGVSSIVNQFKTQDGSLDYTKMMDTAGQMMSAVNQVSTLVKGFGGFFKASV